MEEVTGDWKGQRKEDLHDLYVFMTVTRDMKSNRIRRAGKRKGAKKVVVGNPEGKMPLG
jgi:hypothetical protein